MALEFDGSRQLYLEKKGVYLTHLKPLTKLKNRGFMAFDCETKDGLVGSDLFSYSLAYFEKNREIKSIQKVVKDNFDFDELFEFLRKEKDKTHKRIVFVHNLAFDERFIENYCVKKKIKYTRLPSGSSTIEVVIEDYNVVFRDTMQFLMSSQDEAENDFEVNSEFRKSITNSHEIFEKMYSDWNDSDKDNVILHNKNDTIALLNIMKKFREIMFEICNVDMLTVHSLASLGMKAFRISLYNKEKPEESIKIENPFISVKWKEKNGKMRPSYQYDKNKEEFVRKTYFGGRNEIFDMNTHKNVYYLDMISAYTARMKYNFYPTGFGQWLDINDSSLKIFNIKRDNKGNVIYNEYYKIDEFGQLQKYKKVICDYITINQYLQNKYHKLKIVKEKENIVQDYLFKMIQDKGIEVIDENGIKRIKYEYEGFMECKIYPPKDLPKYPVFPIRLDKKIMFLNSQLIGIYALPELRYAYSLGYEIEPIKGFIFNESKVIFSKYIDKLYPVKCYSKGGKKKCAKIALHCVYGKTGQTMIKRTSKQHYFDSEEEQFEFIQNLPEKTLNNNTYHAVHNPKEDFYVVTTYENQLSLKSYMNVCIASYVTSLNRIELHKQMVNCEKLGIKVLYVDSDSISIENYNENLAEILRMKPSNEYIKANNLKVEDYLGYWDIEEKFEEVRFLAPKCYIFYHYNKKDKKMEYWLKMKGVEKRKIKEICREAKSIEEIYQIVKEPIHFAQKYLCYNEAHYRGMIIGSKNNLVKHYSFENLKRKFDRKTGFSIAWENNEDFPYKFKKELESYQIFKITNEIIDRDFFQVKA